MSTKLPAKLGRYRIVKHLANGGMAQVLLARAEGIEGFERFVVVKRIHAQRAEDPVFVNMFLDEARLSAKLQHQNIAQVYDIGREDQEYFFAMEYIHGQDLREVVIKLGDRKENLPLEHVVNIIAHAAAGLDYAHALVGPNRKPLGLVHRDVSPANILVGYDGQVKVVDFGIAKAAHRASEDTQGGTLKGKVAYMAPEQCAGQPLDRRADVYALGIVLWELVTGQRLFKADNEFLSMSAIMGNKVPRPSTIRKGLSPALEQIMMKALAHSTAERYSTAGELREALEQFASTEQLRLSTSRLSAYMKELFGDVPLPWLDVAKLPPPLPPRRVTPVAGMPAQRRPSGSMPPQNVPARASATAGEPDFEVELSTGTTELPASALVVPPELAVPPRAASAADAAPATTPATPAIGGSASDISAIPQPATGQSNLSGTPLAWQSGPTPIPQPKSRRIVIAAAAGGVVVLALVLFMVLGGEDSKPAQPAAAPPEKPVEMTQTPTPTATVDAAVAAVETPTPTPTETPVDAPPQTIEAVSARSDWPGTIALCAIADPQTLSDEDRVRCGIAACNLDRKDQALLYYERTGRAARPEIETACKARNITLRKAGPKVVDPCKDPAYVEANPLKCR